jgi:hypothetical protein
MDNIDDSNNNNIQINDFQDIKKKTEGFLEVAKRKIGRSPFIKTDKTIFKKEKKNHYLF